MMKYKNDFPLLTKRKDLIYFDNAATTQKPQVVIDAISKFYSTDNAPVKRGLYQLAEVATEKFEHARKTIASFINADEDETIFTSGATESINFIAATWGMKHLKKGDEIVLTELEHHSNLIPWQECAKKNRCRVKIYSSKI